MSRLVGGHAAVRIMVEEIGDAIGTARLREFDQKVRRQLRANGYVLHIATAKDWIAAMAEVIVADDDKRADQGFRKGIRRIRAQASVD